MTLVDVMTEVAGRAQVEFTGRKAVALAMLAVDEVRTRVRPCLLRRMQARARQCTRVTLTRNVNGVGYDWTYEYDSDPVILPGGDDY